jgi:hypothetical protein
MDRTSIDEGSPLHRKICTPNEGWWKPSSAAHLDTPFAYGRLVNTSRWEGWTLARGGQRRAHLFMCAGVGEKWGEECCDRLGKRGGGRKCVEGSGLEERKGKHIYHQRTCSFFVFLFFSLFFCSFVFLFLFGGLYYLRFSVCSYCVAVTVVGWLLAHR